MFISINICHWLSTNIFFSPSYVIIYHQAKHNPYHWWLCTLTTCKIPDNSYKTSKKYQSLSHGVGERYQRIEYWRYKTYLKVTRLTEGWCNVNIVPDTRIATLKPNDHICTIYLPNIHLITDVITDKTIYRCCSHMDWVQVFIKVLMKRDGRELTLQISISTKALISVPTYRLLANFKTLECAKFQFWIWFKYFTLNTIFKILSCRRTTKPKRCFPKTTLTLITKPPNTTFKHK